MVKVFNYRPQVMNEETNALVWSGSVAVEVPDIYERTKLQAEFTAMAEKIEKSDQASTKRLNELVIERVKSMELKHEESGVVFTDLTELSFYADWTPLLIELAKVVINGPKLKAISQPT
jgi:hypothetical protein